jgi:hypothetical protein
MLGQKSGNRSRILLVLPHTYRKRLDAAQY